MFLLFFFIVPFGLTASRIDRVFLFLPCVQVLCELGRDFLCQLGGKMGRGAEGFTQALVPELLLTLVKVE